MDDIDAAMTPGTHGSAVDPVLGNQLVDWYEAKNRGIADVGEATTQPHGERMADFQGFANRVGMPVPIEAQLADKYALEQQATEAISKIPRKLAGAVGSLMPQSRVGMPQPATLEGGMLQKSKEGIENIMGGSQRPEDMLHMMAPVIAANMLRLSLFGSADELAAMGGSSGKVRDLMEVLRGDASFEKEADEIFAGLKQFKRDNVLSAGVDAFQNATPQELQLLTRIRNATTDEQLGDIAEGIAATNYYKRQAANDFTVGAFGARDRHLTFGPTLKSHADIKTNFPEADFWIIRKGQNAGKVTTEFTPSAIGVRSRNHNIDPTYMRYWMEAHTQQGYFARLQHGAVMPHIRVEDVEAIPVQFRDGSTTIEFGAFGGKTGRMNKGDAVIVQALARHNGDVKAVAEEMGIDSRRVQSIAEMAQSRSPQAGYRRRQIGGPLAELPTEKAVKLRPETGKRYPVARDLPPSRLDKMVRDAPATPSRGLSPIGQPAVDQVIMEASRRGESAGMVANILRRVFGNHPDITTERVAARITELRSKRNMSAPIAPAPDRGPSYDQQRQEEELRQIEHNRDLLQRRQPWKDVPAPARGNKIAPGYDPRVNEVLALPGFET